MSVAAWHQQGSVLRPKMKTPLWWRKSCRFISQCHFKIQTDKLRMANHPAITMADKQGGNGGLNISTGLTAASERERLFLFRLFFFKGHHSYSALPSDPILFIILPPSNYLHVLFYTKLKCLNNHVFLYLCMAFLAIPQTCTPLIFIFLCVNQKESQHFLICNLQLYLLSFLHCHFLQSCTKFFLCINFLN